LKPNGKGACILPHGVLFRGNAEAEIRKNLIQRGLIKAIISLPANLFYGTGIPACIILIDKENAGARRGIFMIDASRGFMKDGPKNRLREMDSRSLYQNNKAVHEVLRYGVSAKTEPGKPSETIHLIDWEAPDRNDFAIAEEVTLLGGYARREPAHHSHHRSRG
jgi:type I restriction enzyme M protein